MQAIYGSTATLAVAVIFYCWRAYAEDHQYHQRTLRERVAYMLWVMATQVE
jgi:hypothetical protein